MTVDTANAEITPEISPDFSGGTGTESSPYLISSVSDLTELATNVNNGTTYSGVYFRQTVDISLTSTWTGIGTSTYKFCGSYDGGGYSITLSSKGLFDYVGPGAYIKNLTINSSTTVSGTFALYANGESSKQVTFEACKNNAGVYDKYAKTGGIVGYASYTNITKCVNNGTITAYGGCAGGIVGRSAGGVVVENCYNTGKIKSYTNLMDMSDGDEAYGIGGNVTRNCYNVGDVRGSCGIGTVYAYAITSGTAENCYYLNTCNIDGNSETTIVGVTAKDAEALKTKSTYTNWDFTTIWYSNGTSYPQLRAFLTIVEYTFTLANNDGTGATSTLKLESGGQSELPKLTRTGYDLIGWIISVDAGTTKSTITKSGSGYILTAGNGDATITAQWKNKLTINFNCSKLTGEKYMVYIYSGDDIVKQLYIGSGSQTITLSYVENYSSSKYKLCFVFSYCGNMEFTTLTNASMSGNGGRAVIIDSFDESTNTATIVCEISNPRVNSTVII